MRRFLSALIVCALTFGCIVLPANAAEVDDSSSAIARVTGRLNVGISEKAIVYLTDDVPLAAGDTISYDCTYTPKSASVDFGYVAPDGKFYSKNSTTGSIDKTYAVANTGMYRLAIRNNASCTVTVTGTVKY